RAARSPVDPIATTTSGAPHGLCSKPAGATARKLPEPVVRTVVVAVSPPALKRARTRSSAAKRTPRTGRGRGLAGARPGFVGAAGAATDARSAAPARAIRNSRTERTTRFCLSGPCRSRVANCAKWTTVAFQIDAAGTEGSAARPRCRPTHRRGNVNKRLLVVLVAALVVVVAVTAGVVLRDSGKDHDGASAEAIAEGDSGDAESEEAGREPDAD